MRSSLMVTLSAVVLCTLLLIPANQAVAHNIDYTTEFSGTGSGVAEQIVHEDMSPWAGWVNLTVTNNGAEPWGDFHFEVYDPYGDQDISNVHWLVDAGHEPTSSQSPLTWVVDNSADGATIDLFFYADPVESGNVLNISVYNENPDQTAFFGVSFYPTPVPEPTTLALLALGGLALVRTRR